MDHAAHHNKRLQTIVFSTAPSALKQAFDRSSSMLAVSHQDYVLLEMVAACIRKEESLSLKVKLHCARLRVFLVKPTAKELALWSDLEPRSPVLVKSLDRVDCLRGENLASHPFAVVVDCKDRIPVLATLKESDCSKHN